MISTCWPNLLTDPSIGWCLFFSSRVPVQLCNRYIVLAAVLVMFAAMVGGEENGPSPSPGQGMPSLRVLCASRWVGHALCLPTSRVCFTACCCLVSSAWHYFLLLKMIFLVKVCHRGHQLGAWCVCVCMCISWELWPEMADLSVCVCVSKKRNYCTAVCLYVCLSVCLWVCISWGSWPIMADPSVRVCLSVWLLCSPFHWLGGIAHTKRPRQDMKFKGGSAWSIDFVLWVGLSSGDRSTAVDCSYW